MYFFRFVLTELRDKYGDVMTVDLPFGTKVVLLNSAEAFWDGAIKNAEYLTERHFDGKNLFTPLGITGMSQLCKHSQSHNLRERI